MVIERKYVSLYRIMLRDPAGWNVIKQAYAAVGMDQKEVDKNLEYLINDRVSIATAQMGCGIPDIEFVRQEFERLDAEEPYDNGLTFADVTRVVVMGATNEKISLCLIADFDGDSEIVAFIGLDALKNNKIRLMKKDFAKAFDPYENLAYGFFEWEEQQDEDWI